MAQAVTPGQIAALARARGYDPNAVLAVAKQEGLGGGIGDGGHAYGPFQLNNAGGVITNQYRGRVNDPAVQAWAWSPEGVNFALDRMGSAKGLRGRQAIDAIVTQFERPANPGREIAGALGAYGSLAGAAAGGAPVAPLPAAVGQTVPMQPAEPADFTPQLLSLAHAAADQQGTPNLGGFYNTLRQALTARSAPPAAGAAPPSLAHAAQGPTLPTGGGRIVGDTSGEQPSFLAALAGLAAYEHAPVDINSGYRSHQEQASLYANRGSNPNPVAPPGHSLHEQGLAADGTVGGVPLGRLPAAVLRRFGLAAVPGDPVHVQILR